MTLQDQALLISRGITEDPLAWISQVGHRSKSYKLKTKESALQLIR
jgi:hypothetical protein